MKSSAEYCGGPRLAERAGLVVIDCQACDFAHLETNPYESSNYQVQYHAEDKPDYLKDMLSQSPWWRTVYRIWLEELGELTEGRGLLEVGCGFGFFIKAAIRDGWKVLGIDPSEVAAQHARNELSLSVSQTRWQHYTTKVDVISAQWFLEHEQNPVDFLSWADDCLNENGVLHLVVPNEWTYLQGRANEMASVRDWWVHDTHVNYFGWASLEQLLWNNGFRIVERMGTWPMEEFIMRGADYTKGGDIGRGVHKTVERVELGLGDKLSTYYRSTGRKAEGRDIIAFAKRINES